MKPMGLGAHALAKAIGTTPIAISLILRGRRAVSADMAIKLERHFGVSPGIGLGFQKRYDLESANSRRSAGEPLIRTTKGGRASGAGSEAERARYVTRLNPDFMDWIKLQAGERQEDEFVVVEGVLEGAVKRGRAKTAGLKQPTARTHAFHIGRSGPRDRLTKVVAGAVASKKQKQSVGLARLNPSLHPRPESTRGDRPCLRGKGQSRSLPA
jgi:addiction module HigA family antidote